MSKPIGSFVDAGTGGESGPIRDTDRAQPVTGGSDGAKQSANGPQIIDGYENAIDPATVKIGAGIDGGARTTKSGRIDRRTRAGRSYTATGSGEASTVYQDIESRISLTEVLFSLHQMGAAFFAVAELELDKTEAEKLGSAIKEVAKFYAVSFDPKKLAIFNLAIVAGGIYGTRFVAIRTRMRIEKGKDNLRVMPSDAEPAQAKGKVNGAPAVQPASVPQRRPQTPSDLWPQSGVIQGDVF
jgi:hypothetical protein